MALKFACMALTILAAAHLTQGDYGQQSQVASSLETGCPRGFHLLAGKCYRFHQDASNWSIAQRRCESEGGALASVSTPDEFESLLGHINANYAGQYWVSGARVCGTWMWTNLGKSMKTAWFGRTPAVSGSRSCGYFCSITLKYWDGNCSIQKKFICELDSECPESEEEEGGYIGNEIEIS